MLCGDFHGRAWAQLWELPADCLCERQRHPQLQQAQKHSGRPFLRPDIRQTEAVWTDKIGTVENNHIKSMHVT